MAIKYKALKDRLPKQDDIDIELPSKAVVKFKSALKYKDGALFEIMGRLERLDSDGMSGFNSLVDDMAVDPEAMRKSLSDEPDFVDADLIGIFQIVGDEFGKQIGTAGESKG